MKSDMEIDEIFRNAREVATEAIKECVKRSENDDEVMQIAMNSAIEIIISSLMSLGDDNERRKWIEWENIIQYVDTELKMRQ